jgi:putative ABC transport system substrate-binding protein
VELVPKRFELLRELVPKARLVGFLTSPNRVTGQGGMAEFLAAARKIGQDVLPLNASTPGAIDEAFAIAVSRRIDALLVDVGPLFLAQREQIVALAALHAIPANYARREFVEAGGLMSYGQDAAVAIRQAANYVGRVLNGEKPSELPVLQPTKFEFAINLKTAKTLGIEFPASFQLRADVVIEK